MKRTIRVFLTTILICLFCIGCKKYVDKNNYPKGFFDIAAHLRAREILPNVLEITHSFPWDANSLVLEMEDQTLVLVDTPFTPRATSELLDWIKGYFGERKIIAINGHFHLDNLGGNQILIEQGIPIYGSDLTKTLLQDKGKPMLQETISYMKQHYPDYVADYQEIVLTPPTEVFSLSKGLTLRFETEELSIFFPGAGHSLDNIVVYFPQKKLLFGGCLVVGWDKIGNISDADLDFWPSSVERLKDFDAKIIVPGHSERLDPELLDNTLRLLSEYK